MAVAVVTGKTDIDKIRQEEEGEHKISIFSDFESEHKQECIQTLIINHHLLALNSPGQSVIKS